MKEDYQHIVNLSPSERKKFFEDKYGQLAGWMTQRDLLFLCSWLPEVAHDTYGAYTTRPMILEVGTFLGSTARGLIALTGGRLSAIDNWKDVYPHLKDGQDPESAWWDTLRNNGMDLSDYVIGLHGGDSVAIGKEWKSLVDILYIDGDHSYDGASNDLRAFLPYVMLGGYLMVDDWNIADVRLATHDILSSSPYNTYKWESVRVPDYQKTGDDEEKLWIVRKM